MFNLNSLHIFLKVADTQGFTHAAKHLHVPKSKVSRLIAQLEEQLNISLFERTTRHVRLTEAGEIFYRYAQRILYEAEQAEFSLKSIATTASGLLRVSASTSVGQYLLGPSLAEFMQRYPDIEIELDISNRRVDLIEEGFDVALRVGELPDSTVVAKRVGVVPLKFYASADYIKMYGLPQNIEELKRHKVICMPNAFKNNKLDLINVAKDENSEPSSIQLDFNARINDFGTIRQLAENGIGIALLPSFMCPKKTSLRAILKQWEVNRSPLQLVYPSRRGVTPKLRVFIDFIYDKLAPQL